MDTVATETHSDARWWPLTWWEPGECSQKGRLGWGIWGIIWCRTKPLASWEGGQEREWERGAQRRGEWRKWGKAPFSSCPLQREWPLTLRISLKTCAPPFFFSVCNTEPQPVQLLPFKLKCSPLQDGERKTDRQSWEAVSWECDREWKRPHMLPLLRRKRFSFHLLSLTSCKNN